MRLCENPKGGVRGCRKLAVRRLQGGHMGEVVEVEVDAHLCAYCASDFEESYRAANPSGFVREVPT